jgi:putative ABC transport system permease protein
VNFGYGMLVRTAGDPHRMIGAVRAAYISVDRTQPPHHIQTLDDYLSATLVQRTFTMSLLALFGALALLLAAVGIYGVISYAVTLRTREVGIRMALGAQRSEVLWMVLRQGGTLAAIGLAAGFTASLALTRFLSSLLYEVRPVDAAVSVGVALVLASVALLASWLPAFRASRVDPMVALRYE